MWGQAANQRLEAGFADSACGWTYCLVRGMDYTDTLSPALSHPMGEGARRAGEGDQPRLTTAMGVARGVLAAHQAVSAAW